MPGAADRPDDDVDILTRGLDCVSEVIAGIVAARMIGVTAGGSNPRPLHCERSALPAAELAGPSSYE